MPPPSPPPRATAVGLQSRWWLVAGVVVPAVLLGYVAQRIAQDRSRAARPVVAAAAAPARPHAALPPEPVPRPGTEIDLEARVVHSFPNRIMLERKGTSFMLRTHSEALVPAGAAYRVRGRMVAIAPNGTVNVEARSTEQPS